MGLFSGLFGNNKKEMTGEEYYILSGQYIEDNKIALALDALQKSADKGYTEGEFVLGNIYYNGEFVQKDLDKAFKYTNRAAAKGHIEAKYHLGCMYDFGAGVERDREKAFGLWKAAAAAGHENAKFLYDLETYYEYEEWNLAMDCFRGTNGHEVNIPKALEILNKGVNVCKDVDALMLLGLIDIAGALPYVSQNIEEGVNKFIRSAKEGGTEAFMHLMTMYEQGTTLEGVVFEKNESLAGKLAVEIADSVDEDVNDRIWGHIYGKAARACINGCGVSVDYKKAATFYNKIKEYHRKGYILELGEELKRKGF